MTAVASSALGPSTVGLNVAVSVADECMATCGVTPWSWNNLVDIFPEAVPLIDGDKYTPEYFSLRLWVGGWSFVRCFSKVRRRDYLISVQSLQAHVRNTFVMSSTVLHTTSATSTSNTCSTKSGSLRSGTVPPSLKMLTMAPWWCCPRTWYALCGDHRSLCIRVQMSTQSLRVKWSLSFECSITLSHPLRYHNCTSS